MGNHGLKQTKLSDLRSWIKRHTCTGLYIILIVLVNMTFAYAPAIHVWGTEFSSADMTVGIIYVMRDFAQREIGHRILPAMMIGCFFSYFLAGKQVAFASITSFGVGEFVDWIIFTYTKKPLSQRLIWSSVISVPIDSVTFLYLVHQLNWAGMIIITAAKLTGIFLIWYYWRMKNKTEDTVNEGLQEHTLSN